MVYPAPSVALATAMSTIAGAQGLSLSRSVYVSVCTRVQLSVFVEVDGIVVVPLLSLRDGAGAAVAMLGLGDSGYWAAYVDISPQYAGILLGLGNTLANFAGILVRLSSLA